MTGFAITTHNLPSLRSFEECEKFFNETDRPRGWGQDTRPLESSTMRHKSIMFDNAGPGNQPRYSLMLYDTVLVEYKPGVAKIHLDDRASSIAFIRRFMPQGLSLEKYGRNFFVHGTHLANGDTIEKVGNIWRQLREDKPVVAVLFNSGTYYLPMPSDDTVMRLRKTSDPARLGRITRDWDDFVKFAEVSIRFTGATALPPGQFDFWEAWKTRNWAPIAAGMGWRGQPLWRETVDLRCGARSTTKISEGTRPRPSKNPLYS